MNLDLLAERSILCDQNTDTNKVFTAQKLADLNEAGFIIGGSLALRLYGYDIKRRIDEVDLIVSTGDFNVSKIIKYFEELTDCKNGSQFGDSKFCFEGLNGEFYGVLICNVPIDYTVKIIDGTEVKLQDEEDIWFKKKEYAFKGYNKHEFDLERNKILTSEAELSYFNREFPKSNDLDLDLPF